LANRPRDLAHLCRQAPPYIEQYGFISEHSDVLRYR
jgi:hypothetical protein